MGFSQMNRPNTLLLLVAFGAGVIFQAASNNSTVEIFPKAHAEVADMDYQDLRRDRDFKKAVQYIVESCEVDGEDISC